MACKWGKSNGRSRPGKEKSRAEAKVGRLGAGLDVVLRQGRDEGEPLLMGLGLILTTMGAIDELKREKSGKRREAAGFTGFRRNELVDFESWQMVPSKSENNSDQISGGYSFNSLVGSSERQLDIQCNTYSFGVLLLEIISRRHPFCKERGCLVDWAAEYLQNPDLIGKLVDPELKDVKVDDLAVICSVVSLCIDPDPSRRPSMQIIASVLENGIDISAAAILKDSPLAWADLALAS